MLAQFYCVECGTHFCMDCIQRHHQITCFRRHSIVVVNSPVEGDLVHCKRHPGHQSRFSCRSCRKAVCLICAVLDHSSHDVDDNKGDARENTDNVLREYVEQLGTITESSDDVDEIQLEKNALKNAHRKSDSSTFNEGYSPVTRAARKSSGSFSEEWKTSFNEGYSPVSPTASPWLEDKPKEGGVVHFDYPKVSYTMGQAEAKPKKQAPLQVALPPPKLLTNHVDTALELSNQQASALATLERMPKLMYKIDRNHGVYFPEDVIFLPNHGFATTDRKRCKLHVFDRKGRLELVLHDNIEPWGVAVTQEGNLCVTDRKEKCIKIFSLAGKLLTKWGEGMFDRPSGIAVNGHGHFIISDTHKDRISVHHTNGELIRRFGSCGPNDNQFDYPFYVACDTYNRIIVSDSGNHSIKVFSEHGDFLFRLESWGGLGSRLEEPAGVCTTPKNNIVVADSGSHRVSLFGPNGQFIKHLLLNKDGMDEPCGVAISKSGRLLITDSSKEASALRLYTL